VVTTTPTTAAGQEPRAHLEIVRPVEPQEEPIVPLRFNPTEYQVSKSNTFSEIPIPGLETPLLQYVRGGSEMLTLEALVDTSDTLVDVRERYVNRLRGLMSPNAKEHAPPIVSFVWDSTVFTGVLESLGVTYVLFAPDGVPLRARLSLSLKQYRPAAVQAKEPPRRSPTVDKSYQARRGDTLSSISNAVYRDPARWREIARANRILDPRRLEPGRVLTVPRLR
jgi:Contractile injection system tube protein/LysM domain